MDPGSGFHLLLTYIFDVLFSLSFSAKVYFTLTSRLNLVIVVSIAVAKGLSSWTQNLRPNPRRGQRSVELVMNWDGRRS